MRTERFEIHPEYGKAGISKLPEKAAWVEAWILDHAMDKAELEPKKPAMIVVPGGGYYFLSNREADPIAAEYLSAGFSTFILHYTVPSAPFPTDLMEAAETIRIVRERSEEWGIDPERVYVIGFSAGGHLAASLSVLWNKGFLGEALGCAAETLRPDGCILGYPVISPLGYRFGQPMREGYEKTLRCFDRILEGQDEEAWVLNSLDLQADEKTPPVFIFSTWQDKTVPIEQSLVFANALLSAGVETEVHIFRRGHHGLATAEFPVVREESDDVTPFRKWVELSVTWIRDLES